MNPAPIPNSSDVRVFGNKQPLVSALVTLYNSERFLQGVLENLEAQTIADELEIIIIETGSQEKEIEIIREFQEKFGNIIYVRTSIREFPPAATNRGIRLASGKYLTIANSDDRHRLDAFEIMVGELESNPQIGLVYGDIYLTGYENQSFNHFIRCGYSLRPEFSKEIMLTGCHMGPQPMWRKEVHDKFGNFDASLNATADYEFWCRIAQGYAFKHIPQFLGVYFHNPQGMVNSNSALSLEQTNFVKRTYQEKFPSSQEDFITRLHYLKKVQVNKYVNICMVTFNRLEFTKPAIASILEFTCYPPVITVVDNGSTDGTVEYLQALKYEGIITNLVLLKENVGVAKASNLAWSQEPEAEYYMKYDNDIVLQKPQWLERMIEVMDAIPELAMLAYNFEPISYSVQTINGQQVRLKKGNLGGACVLIPKRTQDQLGFWCEEYGLYGEEDADYGLRLKVAGLNQAYMEDEEIGVHLPAGRAASIDPASSIAEDGMEEYQHTEYRQFKDAQRRVNTEGRTKENFKLYQEGRKSLYCTSQFVETFHHDVLEPLPSSVSLNSDENFQHALQLRRRVSVIANDSFCGGVRLIYPLQSLVAKKEMTGQFLVEGNIWKGEVELPVGPKESIVVQRIANFVEPRLQAAKSQGTRIVHDFDDLLWKIPQDNQNYQIMTRPMLECFFRVMSHADCVTVSTEPLREALSALNIHATVLPNCIFPEDWSELNSQRGSGQRPRVGWVGQVGVHREDVAILLPLIEILGQEVEWVFLGEMPDVRGGVRFSAETHSMVPLQDFPKKLASLNLDLALAPLALNEFNEAKSDLRVLQYGILGYPVVATDIFPYQTSPVTRVSNDPASWARAIREHINDPDASETQGEKLRQWVLSNRMFDQWASCYQEAWLGESIEEKEISESEYIPRISLSESPLRKEGGKVIYDCSIIIPVFNKLDLTRQCLTHLANVTDGCSYEVIVVDNASTDGTGPFLSSLEGDIQIIKNDSNLGFAKACNQGAKAAKGKYLVFLNNDTISLEGWLSALVEEVEQHSDVAVVGSKLLYENGTIQHAGVVFSKKLLTPYHLFNRLPSDFNAANIRQEFQAVTAACLLIRTDVFHSVSGFDEQFVNGFEDVDLCLKIRESGQLVIYQPKSILYHLEEQTPGRKNPETEMQNSRLLMDRWADRIVVDEDVYVVAAGYANRYSTENGKLGLLIEPFRSNTEKSQWELVKNVQEHLLKRRYGLLGQQHERIDAIIRTSLSDASKWPVELETLKWAASICEQLEDVESECGFLKRVLDLGEDREAREKLAREALKHGNFNEASQHVEAILSANPKDGLGLWLEGILAMQSLDYTKSSHSFQQALANGFDAQKTRLGLGMAWIGLGNAQKAWSAFEEAFVADADNKEAVNGLIQSGTMLEWWDKLQSHLARYVDRNPAGCDMRFVLASVCFRAGKIEESKKHYDILQMFSPDYEGLEELGQRLKLSHNKPEIISKGNMAQGTLYDHTQLQSYFQPSTGNTETYIRIRPTEVLGHSLSVHEVLKDYSISGFGMGTDAVEHILSIVFQRQFPQVSRPSCDMWDRVVPLMVDCELVHGISGLSFRALQPEDLEGIDPTFAQREGETRKEEIAVYLNKLKNGEDLGKPLYISGKILQYLGAPAESGAMYMLDGARRLSASALHHQERMPVILLVFEEEFRNLLQEPVKSGIQHHIENLAWFQNYHSFPFLGVIGQRSLQRFKLIDTRLLKDSVVLDFGCNLGQASLKAIQCGAKEVWGIEGMSDTIAVANEIKDIASCENLHYLHVDFNDPQFAQKIDRAIPKSCDYAFFFSVYRTKELLQRDTLFRYILQKVSKGVFFEGHAHPKIDTIDYYEWLFESFNVPYTFLGFSEQQIRPLFFLDLEKITNQQHTWMPQSTPNLHSLDLTRSLSHEDHYVKK